MSQISKCPKVTVVLTYWEASGDVSELRYKSLLYFSSKRSYCSTLGVHFAFYGSEIWSNAKVPTPQSSVFVVLQCWALS